jgi:acetyltransferase-like isoleucine patch superfamily enzyme
MIEGLMEVMSRPRWRVAYALGAASRRAGGIEAINEVLLRRTRGVAAILSQFGAQIDGAGVIHGPLIVHNAARDYSNLTIGENVHLGRGALLDLTDRLTIEAEATVSMNVVVLTHADVGARPLADQYPRQVSPTIIGRGSYIGASATILAGCHVGALAVVGAGAVVTEPVPAGSVVAGVPARVISETTPA